MKKLFSFLIGTLSTMGFLLVLGAVSTETLTITEMVAFSAAGLLAMLLGIVVLAPDDVLD